MKYSRFLSLALLSLALLVVSHRPAEARDEWIQVRSKNFFLFGNASEKDIRKVGTRLEQFRETFRLVFSGMTVVSPIPTNVVVFKSDSSFKNFKPKRADGKIDTGVAGFFQPGEDVNYITLSTEGEDADTFGTIFHEYVHFIVATNFGKSEVPAWFNEGLAEYYQTFVIIEDQKVKLGIPQNGHLFLLQQNKLMPLDTLFNISNHQLLQTAGHSRHIFYAQSWALMHYLLQGGKTDGLGKFLTALSSNVPAEKAFQDAFQTNYAQMENDLRKYVVQRQYNYNELTFRNKLTFDAAMQVEPMGEAASNAYLGDLLYHTNRGDDAEPFLQTTLRLQPDSSMANTTLGMVKIKQRKWDEARKYLEKAITGDIKNHSALYQYAYLLSREGRDEFGYVQDFNKETLAKMRAALNKAIALNPAYTQSYELLAFVNLVNNEELDESVALLRKALKYQPGNQRYALRMADILARQNKLAEAGVIAEKIARTSDDPETKSRAESLRNQIAQRKEFEERRAAGNRGQSDGSGPGRPPMIIRRTGRDKPLTERELAKAQEEANFRSINQALRKPADGEQRIIGQIQKIDCKARGTIAFVVKTAAESFTLASKDFQGLTLNAFDAAASNTEVGCDGNIAAFNSVVTYRPAAMPKSLSRGELVAIEFVPANFRLMTTAEMRDAALVVYEESDPDEKRPEILPPGSNDAEARRRAAMMQGIKSALKEPAAGEKREIGFLDKIECTGKGAVLYHMRTPTRTLRLLNASPQTLPIRIFTPDLDGLQFGCTLKPVELPAVFIYTDKPDAKAKTAGAITSVDFVPKSFVLDQ